MKVNELWVITAYFNWPHFRSKYLNYEVFRESLRAANINTLTIECALDSDSFDLPESDTIRVRTGSVLWQKERLLNLALNLLPSSCNAVAWLDCDLIFPDETWPAQTVELLQFYPVIQLFDTIVRLPKGALSETPDALRYPGFAFHALEDPAFLLGSEGVHIGLPGFAWAARRSVIEQVGFYDAAVVGGADRLMAQTWFGYYEFPTFDAILPPKARKTFYHWAVRAARSVQGRPGYLPGTLLHLWHGEHVDRQYNERHTVLKTYDFDPCTDLKTNALGCWEWNSDKKAMHDVIKSYFLLRKEDG